jgi:iron complex outermembrane receptor protein
MSNDGERFRIEILGLLLPLALPGIAAAQQSAGAKASGGLEEIVVTARKREESYLDVPVVSTNLGAADLQVFATDDFYSLADRVPTLMIGENTGPFGGNITLRGVGTSSFSSTIDQSVSLNIDGVQISKGYAVRAGMLDVAQVEVLKGPQALFFGKNSPGGVISMRTADPGADFEISGEVGYETEADEARGQLVVSAPFGEHWGGRLAVSYSTAEGYFKNIAEPGALLGGVKPSSDRANEADDVVARGTLTWRPSDRFDAKLKYTLSRTDIDGNGGDGQLSYCPEGPFDPLDDCKLDDTEVIADVDPAVYGPMPNDGRRYIKEDIDLGSLTLNFNLTDALSLTSVPGYVKHKNEFLINGTMQPGTVDQTSQNPVLQFLFAPFPVPAESVTIAAYGPTEEKSFTEELRLQTDFDDAPLNGMLGFFYEDGDYDTSRVNLVPLFGGRIRDYSSSMNIETISVFGQLIWNVNERLELAAGARWTSEKRDYTQTDKLTNTDIPSKVQDIDADDVSPEVTVTWHVNDGVTLFAAYKEGFKSGSFNIEGAPLPNEDVSFGNEEAKGGELGLKALLLDDTLRLSGAIYSYKYDNLQVSQVEFRDAGAGTLLKTVNAATATSEGVEMDATFRPSGVAGLTLNAAVAYNKAEFDDFKTAGCYGGQTVALGCDQRFDPNVNGGLGGFSAQDLSGERLPRAPEWSGSVGFDYQRSIGTGSLMLGLAANATYTDEIVRDISYSPGVFQDSYTKTNAALRLFSADNTWEVALIGNNLGDEVTADNCFVGAFGTAGGLIPNVFGLPFNGGNTDEAICFAERGREVWVRASYRFAGAR